MRLANIITGIVFALIGIIVILGSLNFVTPPAAAIGPGFFPKVVGSLLIGLGLLLSIVSFFQRNASISLKNVFGKELKTSLITILIFGIYLVALHYIGFLISSVVFIAVMSRFLGEKRPLVIISVSIVFTGLLYYIFDYLLAIPLPASNLF